MIIYLVLQQNTIKILTITYTLKNPTKEISKDNNS